MIQIINPKEPRLQVADILRNHIGDYQQAYPLWPEHRKIVSDLLNCRTPYLGGRVERCDNCGTLRVTYYSCRNRHCPRCQHMPREQWLEKRKDEILPVSYFHVVFTLPHELNTVILNNKKVMFNILFAAASRTLLNFGENEFNTILDSCLQIGVGRSDDAHIDLTSLCAAELPVFFFLEEAQKLDLGQER
jgi:hypothetical protein